MSTIKSSAEDLTLNADGSNEIKFQINAVEKASISSAGLLTSTTIDATALTGNLPAIDGSSLTGLTTTGLTTVGTATLNLDGTIESSPAEGDIWYNNGKFYLGTSLSFTGVWSSGGNVGTARRGLAGAGTQSAGLCMGGYVAALSNVTEEYDGTSWSSGGNLGTARETAGAGTQSAGLCMGGYVAAYSNVTEEYDPGPGSYDELFTPSTGL